MSDIVSKPNELENDGQFDAIIDEILQQERTGQNPRLEDFERRYPDHAADLREIFSTLLMAERMDNELSRANQLKAQQQQDNFEYPRQIGDFELLHELGRGGMGVVFAARQISLNRMVAIKLLARHLATDAKFAERFAREARSAARLQHPHIVAVFSNGSEQGFSYYSMQLVEGKNLAEVLTGVKRLLEDDAHLASDHDDYPRRLLSTAASRFSNSPVTRGTPTKTPNSSSEPAESSSGKTLSATRAIKRM